MNLHFWAWFFLILYMGAMLGIGYLASRRISGADDYATARGAYGPSLLALAFASTAASGATFLGLPGLAYTYGVSALWIAFLYPIGIYLGIMLCQRTIGRFGNLAKARSIPEYLGERYQSEWLRLSAAVFSLILLFYLAGQLVAGLVMFEIMLGIPQLWAMGITIAVLLGYITLGGAHADILTDGLQAILMLGLAVGIVVMFLLGTGVGGFGNLLKNLKAQDPQLLHSFHPSTPVTASIWAYASIVLAHIPLGLLPHIGNKLWALKGERARNRFLVLAFVFGTILPAITVGGLLARGVLGDSLIANSATGANSALPALFIQLFPSWLSALLGVGVLAAIMSTADGLVISSSQVLSNDIYRRSIAPRWRSHLGEAALDKSVLRISRISTMLILLGSAALATTLIDLNINFIVWAGVGGFIAALAGPLVFGVLWSGVTRTGALVGFWSGAILFVLIHGRIVRGEWLTGTGLEAAGTWFDFYAPNPYSAATLAGLTSVLLTTLISLFTRHLPATHLAQVMGREVAPAPQEQS